MRAATRGLCGSATVSLDGRGSRRGACGGVALSRRRRRARVRGRLGPSPAACPLQRPATHSGVRTPARGGRLRLAVSDPVWRCQAPSGGDLRCRRLTRGLILSATVGQYPATARPSIIVGRRRRQEESSSTQKAGSLRRGIPPKVERQPGLRVVELEQVLDLCLVQRNARAIRRRHGRLGDVAALGRGRLDTKDLVEEVNFYARKPKLRGKG